jgi:WD40 repeat protein/DNA-binding SARP family transcriptional activator
MPERSARNNLRNTLYQLRRLIEGEDEMRGTPTFLLTHRQNIQFNHDFELALDVTRFEILLNEYQTHNHSNPLECSRCLQSLEEAATIYQGSFLSDFYLEDSNTFEDWAAAKRQAYEQQALDILESLTAIYIHQGKWEQAKTYAQRQMAIDNLRESAHRQYMKILARMGRRTEAIRHYEELSVYLDQELGVLPSDQTQALYQAILAGQLPTPQETQKTIAVQPPFKGLQPFEVADANLFFGRETLISELVERLHRSSFLAVVGASGSGKSSLVRAGLIPALMAGNQPSSTSNNWKTVILTPTAHPIENLAASLTQESESVTATTTLMDDLVSDSRSLHLYARKLLIQHNADHLVLVVDQFEELFTLCHNEAERIAFINNLVTAGDGASDKPTKVVIIIRADFYAHCARYPTLRALLETYQALIGPMAYHELRRAIEEPALQKGYDFEPGLVDLFLRDVGAGIDSQAEPGALPLLSHALLETWRHRQNRTMTLQAYHQVGGVVGAIAQTAEVVYNQQLTSEQQAVARKIFLHLTELGEDTPDTRRRTSLEILKQGAEAEGEVANVIGTLADARLIITSKGMVEIAHEALIREWPRLKEWLEANRAELREQRALTRAAREWLSANRDPSYLLRGTRLDQVLKMVPYSNLVLSNDEQDYLDASLTERSKRRRWILLGSTVGLIVILIFASLAVSQWVEAENAARFFSVQELSRAALDNLEVDPEMSVLLALEAVSQKRLPDGMIWSEGEQALHQAVQASHIQLSIPGLENLGPASFSPNGTIIAAPSEDQTIKLWNVRSGDELLSLPGESFSFISRISFNPNMKQIAAILFQGQYDIQVWSIDPGQKPIWYEETYETRGHYFAFSKDGSRLAIAAGTSSTARVNILDAASGELLQTLPFGNTVKHLAFSPDGNRLAVGIVMGLTEIWDFETQSKNLRFQGDDYTNSEVLFSPDGTLIAVNGNNQVTIVNAITGQQGHTFTGTRISRSFPFFSGRTTAFSPDSKRLATLNQLGQIIIWDLQTGNELYHFSCTPSIIDFNFNPNFSRVVVTDANGSHKVCDTSPDHEALISTAHANEVNNVTFNPEGTRLVSGGNYRDGVMIWDITLGNETNTAVMQPYRSIFGQSPAAFSPDGTRILIGDPARLLREWDLESGEELQIWKGGDIVSASYSPNGKRLLFGTKIGFVTIYDLENNQQLYRLLATQRHLNSAKFSPDGRRFATTGYNDTIKIWDADTGEELLSLGEEHNYQDIAFSSDGQYVAAGTTDGQVFIWDSYTGEHLQSFDSDKNEQIMGIAYTPDGKRLITADSFGQVTIWDSKTGENFIMASLPNAVLDVDISADGRFLATGSEDGTVRVFLLDINELIDLAKSQATRGFTQEECQKYLHQENCPDRFPE